MALCAPAKQPPAWLAGVVRGARASEGQAGSFHLSPTSLPKATRGNNKMAERWGGERGPDQEGLEPRDHGPAPLIQLADKMSRVYKMGAGRPALPRLRLRASAKGCGYAQPLGGKKGGKKILLQRWTLGVVVFLRHSQQDSIALLFLRCWSCSH